MLIDTLKKENMLALKNKDTDKRAVLSIVINKYNIMNYEAKANGKEIGDAEMLNIINKTIKELEDERQQFVTVGNQEKVTSLDNQIAAVVAYAPKMLTEEEIKNIILSLEDRSMPVVMKHFKQKYNGLCDMGLVNKVLRSL